MPNQMLPKILTEEDLERIRYKYTQSHFGGRNSYSIIDGEIADLIASHQILFAANAELSFKIAEQRKTIDHQHILLDKYEFMMNGGN